MRGNKSGKKKMEESGKRKELLRCSSLGEKKISPLFFSSSEVSCSCRHRRRRLPGLHNLLLLLAAGAVFGKRFDPKKKKKK